MSYKVSDEFIEQYSGLVRKVNGIRGGGICQVNNTPDGITIIVPPQAQSQRRHHTRPQLLVVLVKQSGGSNGTWDNTAGTGTRATWTYDIYSIDDTDYATKLNTDGALQPMRSAARVAVGPVTQASDGDPGLAYYDANGDVQLWDCPETVGAEKCS